MTETTTKQSSPVQLKAEHGSRQVVITTEQEDRFVMSCANAVEACLRHKSEKIVRSDIEKMIAHSRAWSAERGERISAAFIGPHESKITVFVVPKSEGFDFDLAEEVAELAHDLSRTYQAVWSDALEVPGGDDESLRTFIDFETVIPIYGQTAEPPR
jgi:hypothetical protein